MTDLEYASLSAQGFNRIPLIAEAFADLETPLSLYLKLAYSQAGLGRNSFMLESVVGGERFGRYSFIGLPARTCVRVSGDDIKVITDGKVVEQGEVREGDTPLDWITQYQARFKVALRPGMPRFCGGLAGYFGYDAVRYIEKKLKHSTPPDTLNLPDIVLMLTEELAVIDNLTGKLYFIVYTDPATADAYMRGKERLRELKDRLLHPVLAPSIARTEVTPVERSFAKDDYILAVLRAKEYISAGDMMQVQIGQRLSKRFKEPPLSLYRALRSLNPSPYMYFYNFGDFHVVGASPEILVRQEQVANTKDSKAIIRPLAGTRPRGGTVEQDVALEKELLADPKERAEHVMLIDLARNDIGRVAKIGTVKVLEQMAVERYSHVMHIVSHVEGTLNEGVNAMDVFKATFPAGTLTGAPKVRAMEIIDELEPTKRGLYGGGCGYLSFAGDMDLAIAIRTGIIKDGRLYVQAAAGVVADSDPEMEWKETEAKARAVLRAAELVQQGLDE
jgi:anthranilate synthase component I